MFWGDWAFLSLWPYHPQHKMKGFRKQDTVEGLVPKIDKEKNKRDPSKLFVKTQLSEFQEKGH